MYDGVITAKDTIHTDCVETKSQALEAQKWANGTEPKKLVYGDNVVVNPQYPIASGLQFKNNAKYYAEEAKKYKEEFDAFFKNAEIGEEAIDTLKEIQDYIDNHGADASNIVVGLNSKVSQDAFDKYKGEAENKFVSKDKNGDVVIDGNTTINKELIIDDGHGSTINVTNMLYGLPEQLNDDFNSVYGAIDSNTARLDEIEEHLAPKYIITDDKTAYRKDVPLNACSKAQLNSIGGMSYVDEATNTFVDAKVTELKSEGANLIPYPYLNDTLTSNGITYVAQSDGGIKFNGTSIAKSYFNLRTYRQSELSAGTYSVTIVGEGAEFLVECYNGNTWIKTLIHGNGTIVVDWDGYTEIRFLLYIYKGRTVDSTVYPMCNKGTTALPYEPFKEAETIFQIPPEIQALPNYGKMFTKLDLVNKKFIDEYAEMDGVVSWNENPVSVFEIWADDYVTVTGYDCSVQFMRGDLMDDGNIGPVITEKPYDSIEYVGKQFILRKRVAQLDWWYTNHSDYEALIEELFGKVTIVCKTSFTPIYHDISSYIDNNIIKVTAGGAIEFVNENKQPVPSSISYMMGGHLLEKEV
jgi:hypothetical protein